MKFTRLFPLLGLLGMAACDRPPAGGPLVVSVIGAQPGTAGAIRAPIAAPEALLLASVAQGLVRLDPQGQIEAGLAARWDVSDDGLYYTFRIIDGSPIDAETAARLLRRAIARDSRNPLKPLLGAVAEIVAVTPEVIEIRLSAPRPDLLQLLAAPEMSLARRGTGGGPFRLVSHDGGRFRLLLPAPVGGDDDPAPASPPALTLRAERAALAVARYAAGQAVLVDGGRFADLELIAAAGIDRAQLRFDPVAGLFGLRVMRGDGWLADAGHRLALAQAIDRVRIVRVLGLPGPAVAMPPAAAGTGPSAPLAPLRIALPGGAGARLLFRLIAADWRRIGIAAVAVPIDDRAADLRLIDEVAPTDADDTAAARFACADAGAAPCSPAADSALAAARAAGTPADRAARLAEATQALAAAGLFIPIAPPVRWSLVSPGLTGWQENPRGIHPLDQLRR